MSQLHKQSLDYKYYQLNKQRKEIEHMKIPEKDKRTLKFEKTVELIEIGLDRLELTL